MVFLILMSLMKNICEVNFVLESKFEKSNLKLNFLESNFENLFLKEKNFENVFKESNFEKSILRKQF